MSDGDTSAGGAAGRSRSFGCLLAAGRVLLILVGLILAVLALWKGGWYALIAWLLTLVLLIDTSVNVFYSVYEETGSRRWGWLLWIAAFLLGFPGAQRITSEGKLVPTKPPGPLGRLFARFGVSRELVIEGGWAAVLERRGQFTRVCGPGRYTLQRFEEVAHVIDLRPQVRTVEVKGVRTADGLTFDVELDARFRISATDPPGAGGGTGAAGTISQTAPSGSGADGSGTTTAPPGAGGGTGTAGTTSKVAPSGSGADGSQTTGVPTATPTYPFSATAIQTLVYNGGILYQKEGQGSGNQLGTGDRSEGRFEDWRDTVVRVVQQAVRDVAAGVRLEQILSLQDSLPSAPSGVPTSQRFPEQLPQPGRAWLGTAVFGKAKSQLEKLGVELLGIDLQGFVVPPEVQDFFLKSLRRQIDIEWARAQEEAIHRIAEGLQKALGTIRQATEDTLPEIRPHLLVTLTDLLQRISQDFLRLTAPYRTIAQMPPKAQGPATPEGKE